MGVSYMPACSEMLKKKKKELILSNNDANGGLSIEPGAAEQNLIIYIKCKSALTTPYIF